MKVSKLAGWVRRRESRWVLVCVSGIAAAALFAAIGQPIAAALVVIVGVLLLDIEQRNARVRHLAQHLVLGHPLEKLEVPRGAWGELCRAINTMVQEQRLQEKLRASGAASLPEAGVRALFDGSLPGGGSQRTAAVLMVSCLGPTVRRSPLHPPISAWQALADSAQATAQQYGALLQPCGDAIMLVFGAFTDLTPEVSLLAAVSAADSLRASWRGSPLALSITSGVVAITSLPGLGYCAIGDPVEQAVQIERIALSSSSYGMLCDMSAYYALRRHAQHPWQPTEFRIQSRDGHPQIVYGMPTR